MTCSCCVTGRDANSENVSSPSPGEFEGREQPQQPGGGGAQYDVAGQQTNEKSLHRNPLDARSKKVRPTRLCTFNPDLIIVLVVRYCCFRVRFDWTTTRASQFLSKKNRFSLTLGYCLCLCMNTKQPFSDVFQHFDSWSTIIPSIIPNLLFIRLLQGLSIEFCTLF